MNKNGYIGKYIKEKDARKGKMVQKIIFAAPWFGITALILLGGI